MTIKKGENEHCSETDKLCGERISSYSKEGSNLLGPQSPSHVLTPIYPLARLSMPACPPVSVRPSICLSVRLSVCKQTCGCYVRVDRRYLGTYLGI